MLDRAGILAASRARAESRRGLATPRPPTATAIVQAALELELRRRFGLYSMKEVVGRWRCSRDAARARLAALTPVPNRPRPHYCKIDVWRLEGLAVPETDVELRATERKFLTVEEVATRLKVTDQTIYNYRDAGTLPALAVGAKGAGWRWHPTVVDALDVPEPPSGEESEAALATNPNCDDASKSEGNTP